MKPKRRELAVPVMASPLPVFFILVVLLLAKSPVCQAGDCKGHRQVLRGPPGYVTDGPGNYSVNGNCEWLIKAPSNSHRIVLNFTFMDTECTYDYLFVYDGDSYQSPLLASLSGNTLPQPIEAKSGKMLLHLFSDANYNLLGFNATYTFSLCPGACGGHGRCDPSTLKCHCHQGWGGAACTTPLCSQACSVNGQCDKKGERCLCNPGFMGHSCELGFHDDSGTGQWCRVSEGNPYTPPRTGSAGVYLSSTGAMYLFGGFDLNRALGDLIKYNFTSNQWESRSYGHSPVARHSHTAVEWTGNMVIFGGELANGSLASDVWMYRPLQDDWQQLGFSSSHGAPKLANHAAAVVDNYLYVFGGRTEEDMFSSSLYRFGLHGSGRWETVQPTGGKPPATAGHSMVFHSPSRTLLVYGGHRPTTARELGFKVQIFEKKVESYKKTTHKLNNAVEYIKYQAGQAEKQIKAEFERLHTALVTEEALRLKALAAEEEEKIAAIQELIANTNKDVVNLKELIDTLKKEMGNEDLPLLKNFQNLKRKAQWTREDPRLSDDSLLNMGKHVGALSYKIWKNMQAHVKYNPVVLNPNSASPWLSLNADLTSVKESAERLTAPDNPERFDPCVFVLGVEGYTAGKHRWDVIVGDNPRWIVGVCKESVTRKKKFTLSTSHGVWSIGLSKGVYTAPTPERTELQVQQRPEKIRIKLNMDKGEVSFWDGGTAKHLVTLTHKFDEKMFPIFGPGLHNTPMILAPGKIAVHTS